MVLAPYCGTHGSRVLLPAARILAVFNTTRGIHVAYRCWCDDVGIWKPDHLHEVEAPERTGEAARSSL